MNFRRPLFLLVLSALLPLVLLSALVGAAWIRDQQQVLEHDALAKVDRIAALIDRELAAQLDVLRAMASAQVFDGPLDLKAVADYVIRMQRQQPLWHWVIVSDVDGNRLLTLPAVEGAPGKVSEPESHARAVASQQPTIGRIRRGPLGNVAFPARMPVVRDGKVLCVLNAVITPEAINRLLLSTGQHPEWIGAVVDDSGRLVARTKGAAERIGAMANQDAVRVVRERTSGIYEGNVLEGWPAIFAFQTVPVADWSVHIAMPRDLYNAPLRRSAWVLGAGGLASLVIAAILSVLLWREVQRRREEEAAQGEVRRIEALGMMTGGVAHDFNNLLMIVQGSAEGILRRSGDEARVRAYVDGILVAARRGQALTRQLLAFGRRSPYAPISFDLRERSAELLILLQRSTRGDIRTNLDIPLGTWRVHADPEALEVALVNLAVNARDAMPEGGILTVAARNLGLNRRHDEGTGLAGEFVALSVTDTGSGIPEDLHQRIFEPFFTTKPAGQGTGLGLSQVFGFAKQSKGAVTVQSRLGKGTTFTLFLPRSLEARPATASPAPREQAGGGRLLLVEDNHDVARVTREMLEAAGFGVTWVPGADQAMEALEQERFDLMLSDVVMEGGPSGLDLAARAASRWPALPILLMTGYSEALARGEASRWPVLAKPFRQEEALAAIDAALAGSLSKLN